MYERRIEIRWADLDAYGHVYNATYLTYLEMARDEWLTSALAVSPGKIWDYVVARVAIEYRRELRLAHRDIVASCRLADLGRTSITTREEIRTRDGRLAAEAEVVLVAINGKRGVPRPLTDTERQALEASRERSQGMREAPSA